MRKIILSGGGSSKDSLPLDKLLIKVMPKKKRMLYIPIAMNPKIHSYGNCLNWVNSSFNPLGIDKDKLKCGQY